MIRYVLLAAVPSLLLLTSLACGDGQTPPRTSTLEGTLIALDESTASLTLLDVSSGDTIASFGLAGYQTWALYRPSAGELVVSDLEGDDFQGRLRVYDIADLSEAKWTLAMRDRGAATGYAQAMALSNDERYLYYAIHTRDERGEPAAGHARLIGIIDLEARREIDRVELPLGCGGYKTLTAIETSGAQVFCPPNWTVTVSADSAVSEVSPAGLPSWASEPAVVTGCFGPGLTAPCRLDDGRRVLAQRSGGEDNTLNRLLVYSGTNSEDAQTLDLREGVVDFALVESGTVALLEESGTIYLVDLASGEVTGELEAPSGARWLVGP